MVKQMKNNAIEFNFIEHRFEYELPLLGVDLDFVRQRKAELELCMQQLSKRCEEINIASALGVSEFDRANKLVRYYFNAMCKLNYKERQLLGHELVLTDEQQDKHQIRMREYYREKTA